MVLAVPASLDSSPASMLIKSLARTKTHTVPRRLQAVLFSAYGRLTWSADGSSAPGPAMPPKQCCPHPSARDTGVLWDSTAPVRRQKSPAPHLPACTAFLCRFRLLLRFGS